LAFEGDGKVVRYPGGYDSYRALRDEAAARAEQKIEKPGPKQAPIAVAAPVAAAPKKLTHAERIELEGILDRIAGAEALVTKLEAQLADPNVYGKGADTMKQLRAEYTAAGAEVSRLLARWEALEARR
jgi:ATP-binding cassette subfamily F protein uup